MRKKIAVIAFAFFTFSTFFFIFPQVLASPGNLRVYVQNVGNGEYISGARVVLYDASWNLFGEKITNSLGYVYWSSLP